jgi:Homeodomain-like domain
VKAEHLELSKLKKAELYDFMKGTRDKEEYRRASAIKQKLEGLPYRTIATNLEVNYRNVYNWIQEYKEYELDGIRSKRKNAGRTPKTRVICSANGNTSFTVVSLASKARRSSSSSILSFLSVSILA